jgi:two-component system response regulator TctD
VGTESTPERRRIVIVEDHDDTREIVANVLTFCGFEVYAFATAEEALEAEIDHPVAFVIDLGLPSMSGGELASRLRRRDRGVPLVALTGRQSARENLDGMWDRVLIKPFDPFELANTITGLAHQP